jgi:hypothetical protein
MHVETQVQHFGYITAMEGEIQKRNYTGIYFCSLLTMLCVFPARHSHYTGVLFLITNYSALCVSSQALQGFQNFKFCPDTPVPTNLWNVQYTSYKKKIVASVLASEYVRFTKNYPILNFQAMYHTTGNLSYATHL